MPSQGYPSSGGRLGAHPSTSGYPATGARYGSHPSGGLNDNILQAISGLATTSFVGHVETALVSAVAYWRRGYNITLGTSLKVTAGTSVPTVGLSTHSGGSRVYASGAPGLRVKITDVSGGTALGQALAQYSVDDGATWSSNVTTSATVDIASGAASGLRLVFGSGTYATDQTWAVTVESWSDYGGNGYTLANATAAQQPIYESAGIDGAPGMLFDGADDRLVGNAAAVYACLTNSPAFTVAYKVAYTSNDALGVVFSVGNSGSASTNKRQFGQTTTGTPGRHRTFVINSDASVNQINDDANIPGTSTSPVVCMFYSPGTAIFLEVDGTLAGGGLDGDACNPGTLTPNQYGIGALMDSVPDTFLNGRVGSVAIFNSQLDTTNRASWRTLIDA